MSERNAAPPELDTVVRLKRTKFFLSQYWNAKRI